MTVMAPGRLGCGKSLTSGKLWDLRRVVCSFPVGFILQTMDDDDGAWMSWLWEEPNLRQIVGFTSRGVFVPCGVHSPDNG
jgi:hypothetical protein